MTTPDKEEMPTKHRNAGPRWVQSPHHPRVLYDSASNGGIIECDSPEVAAYIATACNAYEPMREALAATTVEVARDLADFLSSVCVVRDEGPDRSTLDPEDAEEVARLECIIWRARAALSTLPVNDRQTSDDVGIFREALAKIAKIAFEDAADPKTDRLSTVYVIARAALKGPASETGKLSTDEVTS